ncbi:MAG: L,D-transpeptidase family protein [Hyphomicrobiaceae bacterium]|nr:L,D-transpeptidase family protein [Hyphomicrobiaceae bacterium]
MTERRGSRQMVVTATPGRPDRGHVRFGHLCFACALGRAGIGVFKAEGDGRTPAGTYPWRRVLYRPDRVARPRSSLPVAALRTDDGWCDAPGDRNYNRPVRHPYPASAERLWRCDGLYDIVVVVGHNDLPRRRGAGSAIFFHVARPGLLPTEGCVALRRRHLLRLVALMRPQDRLLVATGATACRPLRDQGSPPARAKSKKARSLLRARAR